MTNDENCEKLKQGIKQIKEAVDLLQSGPTDYYIDKLLGAHDYMMKRFCPFKVGDKVELASTPDISEEKAPGWMGCKQFLKEGSPCIVRSVECDGKGFGFNVEFDKETWIGSWDKQEHTVDSKHTFFFRESFLRNRTERKRKLLLSKPVLRRERQSQFG